MTTPLVEDTPPDTLDALFAGQADRALALRRSTLAQRQATLKRLRQALMAHQEALLQALHTDLGKPRVEAQLTEFMPLLDDLRHSLSHLGGWMRPQRAAPTLTMLGTRARVVYQPRGRCLIIGTWNYPINTLLGPLISALAAGNTVLLKPSEFTPAVNAVLAQLIEATFEPAEVALVQGAVPTASHLLSLPFDHVFFTGSPNVGKLVMAAAARHLGSVTLELGGKSPVVVDASADLRHAAEHILWGKLVNAGQTCVAPDHALVHRSVYDAFLAECRQVLAERFGPDSAAMRSSPHLGRMVSPQQAARVAGLIDQAVALGAQVLAGGGHDASARYVAPTLLGQVPAQARIQQEEIFGPVLPVQVFDTLDEVIDHVNRAPKPLALYLWSRHTEQIERLRRETSSGSFCVNLCMQQNAHNNLPFGGVNHSGQGSSHGIYGFKAFSHERATLAGGPLSALRLFFPPYTARSQWLIQTLLRTLQRG